MVVFQNGLNWLRLLNDVTLILDYRDSKESVWLITNTVDRRLVKV
jgi:hypothetical protein